MAIGKERLAGEKHWPSTQVCLRISGCDSLTPYERRALYQVEELAFGEAGSIKRLFSASNYPCRLRFPFSRRKGDGVGNVAHALEHLIVFAASRLKEKISPDGFLSGEEKIGEDSLPIITLNSDTEGEEVILLEAVRIVTDAVNSKLLVTSGPDRRISFSVI